MRCRADISLSSSARVAGFTATWSAGVGSVGGGTTTGCPFGARVSPVRVPLRRGTATKSPAATRRGRRRGVPGDALQRVQALLLAGARVDEDGVGLQRARDHLAEGHLAGVAVVEGLGHREQRQAARVAGDLGRLGPGRRPASGGRDAGLRAELLDQAGQPVDAHAAGGRAAQDREDAGRGDAAGQALLELGVVEGLPVEVALHEVVVAHHDALDELLVHGVLLVDQVVGDGPLVTGRGHGAVDGAPRRPACRSGWPCRRAGR